MRVRLAVLAGALVGIGSCGGVSEEDAARIARGKDLVSREGCYACHGRDLGGGSMGPALDGLKRRWSTEDLASFLAEPGRWIETSDRLQRLDERFSASMPGVSHLSEQQLTAMAMYLRHR